MSLCFVNLWACLCVINLTDFMGFNAKEIQERFFKFLGKVCWGRK